MATSVIKEMRQFIQISDNSLTLCPPLTVPTKVSLFLSINHHRWGSPLCFTKGFISFHSLEYVCNQQGSEYDSKTDPKGFPDPGSSETPIILKSDSFVY